MTRYDEGFVTVAAGARLYFRRLGAGGRTVVVPNGMYLLDDFLPLARDRTLVAYDPRNRGRSDPVADSAELARGIRADVEDLEAVRRHFGAGEVDLVGHSYVGLTVVLYALAHPVRVGRVVQLSPMEPFPGKCYPAHLTCADETLREVVAEIARLRSAPPSADPVERCKAFWSVLRTLYVGDPADAARIDWGRCELPNEREFMRYWSTHLLPSIHALELSPALLAKVAAPVLTIHGTRDRNAPYGGAREWALWLSNARLVTVAGAGHAPWLEAPEAAFGALETFLAGRWPAAAEQVMALDPREESRAAE